MAPSISRVGLIELVWIILLTLWLKMYLQAPNTTFFFFSSIRLFRDFSLVRDCRSRDSGLGHSPSGLGSDFSRRSLHLYKSLLCFTELHLEEAGRLQRKIFILHTFIIFAIFDFSEHGKQTWLESQLNTIIFSLRNPHSGSLFFFLFLKFLCSVEFRSFLKPNI